MLTSNTLPMLAGIRNGGGEALYRPRDTQDGCTVPMTVTVRRAIRKAERADLARELDAWEGADETPVLIRVTDEFGGFDLDALLYEDERAEADLFDAYGLDDESTYADLVAAVGVTRMGDDDRYALDYDDLPGWGAARVDYADFKSGFRVTDRP